MSTRARLAAALLFTVGCGSKSSTTKPDDKPKTASAITVSPPPVHKPFAELTPVEPALLKTGWTPAELTAECERVEVATDARLAALVAVPDAQRSFAGTVEELEDALVAYSETVQRLAFMKDIHPDAKVRDAGAGCEERASKYGVRVGARKDLYLAMKGYLDNAGKKDTLDPEQQRLVELTMRDFRRNGLELSDAERAKLVDLRQRISELQVHFAKNLGDDKTTLSFTTQELDGLPKDWMERHPKAADGKHAVTVKYPDYFPVMENAKKEETRRRMEVAFMSMGGKENLNLLAEAVQLRAESARVLGFATHLDFVTGDRMAGDAKTVQAFLERMRAGLRPGLESDTAKMQKLKAAETKDKKAIIRSHDWRYYLSQIKKKDYAVDDEVVRGYFPMDKVMGGMFEVYSRVFSVKFAEVANAQVWADGVKLYEVRDQAGDRLLARFYIDFFPREGKYGHAAEFTLSPGRMVKEGYSIPLACLAVNFQPPAAGKSSYLNLKEVETLFHEFGHVMHESLTTARYASQAGTSTARDFVEAPSQMLENWVYSPEVLALISRDPKDASKGLPADLAQKIIKARKYNAGVHYSRQLFLGSFDARIHSTEKADPDAAAKELWASVVGFPEDPNAHFAGTFGHMMGGYDGGYYGYLWSEVYSADMFTRFQQEGVLNAQVGRAYRDTILARGKTVEPMVLLRTFLGREPNEAAFLTLVGITR